MTSREWDDIRRRMDEHEALVAAWEAEPPAPGAARCVHSRHRTLAHFRACGETWLAASRAFVERPGVSITLLHPWRLFDRDGYATLPWDEHRAAFLRNRQEWKELMATADLSAGGKLNRIPHTVESLVRRLVLHEHGHLFEPK